VFELREYRRFKPFPILKDENLNIFVPNGGALRVNSEPPPFFTQDVTDILETYIELNYSLHTLIELLGKPQDMKRFVIL